MMPRTFTKEDQKKITNIFRSLNFSKDFSSETLQTISGSSIKKTLGLNKSLWSGGDASEFIGIIVSGAMEISKISDLGKETSLGIFGPHQSIGIMDALKKRPHASTAKAITSQVEILKVFIKPLMMKTHFPIRQHEVSQWIQGLLLSHMEVLQDKIDMVCAGRVKKRILECFRLLIPRFGKSYGKDSYKIKIPLSKTQISKLVEIRPETIIRILNQWEKTSLIIFNREEVIIPNLSILERYCQEDD